MNSQTNRSDFSENYLLHSTFKLKNSKYVVGCGLSPARSFSSVITLNSNEGHNMNFSTYEWTQIIDAFKLMQREFFQVPNTNSNINDFTPPIQCGEFISVCKLVYGENVKQLMLMKDIHHAYLNQEDVDEILKIDISILAHYNNLLNNLNFCMYYYNVIEIIKNWLSKNKTTLSIDEIIYGFCETSNDSLLCNAMKQFLYYYKDKILDLNKN